MDKLFVKEKYLKILRSIFKDYCPNAEIWAYGSRVDGSAHDGSDLDLAVKTFNDDTKNVIDLKEILKESSIPFLIDIFELDKLPENFQKEIKKRYIVIFPA